MNRLTMASNKIDRINRNASLFGNRQSRLGKFFTEKEIHLADLINARSFGVKKIENSYTQLFFKGKTVERNEFHLRG